MDEPAFPSVVKMMIVFGLLVNLGMIAYGFVWAIPTLGFFGYVWTAVAFGIAVFNFYNYFVRYRRRWRSNRD